MDSLLPTSHSVSIANVKYHYILCSTVKLFAFLRTHQNLKQSFIGLMVQHRNQRFDLTDFAMEEYLYSNQNKKIKYCVIFNSNHILSTLRIVYNTDAKENGYLNLVHTNESFRGRKLCTTNLQIIVKFAKHFNLSTLLLNVNNDNDAAIKCYTRCGFTLLKKNDVEQKMQLIL